MELTQSVLDQITIRHDVVSQFILLGVFQGFFVAAVILLKATRDVIPVKLIGYFLIAFCLVLLDDYLCYTGLMKYVIHLNDTSEPLVLLWAPLLYLFTLNVLEKKKLKFRTIWYHFVIPVVYCLTQIGYYAHPESVKMNAYISAYFPDIKHLPTPDDLSYSYQLVKDEFRLILLTVGIFYSILSTRIILKKSQDSIKTNPIGINKYNFSRNIIIIFFVLMIMAFTIFLNFDNDLGDHYIAIVQVVVVFTISFMIFSESRFFQKSWIADKYDALNNQTNTLKIEDVIQFVEREDYYTRSDASLKDLSKSLNSNVNYISKVINHKTGKNFNEFINSYRIELSKSRLLDKAFEHLTIEAIGNSVGFKSKSAFYKAFKQFTNDSPRAFKENANLS